MVPRVWNYEFHCGLNYITPSRHSHALNIVSLNCLVAADGTGTTVRQVEMEPEKHFHKHK